MDIITKRFSNCVPRSARGVMHPFGLLTWNQGKSGGGRVFQPSPEQLGSWLLHTLDFQRFHLKKTFCSYTH